MADSKAVSSDGLLFCNDVMREILIRVPQKTLYRFKCVSKSWKNLISDPLFLTMFATRSKALPPLMVGAFCYNEYSFCLAPNQVKFYNFSNKQVETPVLNGFLSFLQRSITVVASHNGYILFVEKAGPITYKYVVCNPSTKERVELPGPSYSNIEYIMGVFLVCTENNIDHVEFEVITAVQDWECEWELDIYSSKTREWKVMPLSDFRLDLYVDLHPKLLFNRSIYWWVPLGRNIYVNGLEEESFRELKLPVPNLSSNNHNLHIGTSGESLYLAIEDEDSFKFNVWVLVDGCNWELLHTIDCRNLVRGLPEQFKCIGAFRPLALHPLDHQIVLVNINVTESNHITTGKTVVYHTGTSKIEFIGSCDLHVEFSRVIPFSLPAWLPLLKNIM